MGAKVHTSFLLFLLICTSSFLFVADATTNWTWIPETSTPPSGRVFHNWVHIPRTNRIVLSGGTEGRGEVSQMWVLDIEHDRWSRLATKGSSCPARSHALSWGVIRNGQPTLLVFGGYRWGIGMLNDFCSISLETYTIESVPSFVNELTPNGRSHAPTYHINDTHVGFFGGRTIVHVSKDVWLYDVSKNQWQVFKFETNVPEPRYGHALAYHEGTKSLYAFSGVPELTNVPLDDFWSFSFVTRSWTQINWTSAPRPKARFGAAFCVLGDDFIIAGGQGPDFLPYSDVWKYNVVTKLWTQLPSLDIGRSDATLVPSGNAAYMFGGMTNELGLIGDLLRFAATTTKMTIIHSTTEDPAPRAHHSMVSIGTHALVFGGYDGTTVFNDLWSFDKISHAWKHIKASGPVGRYAHSAVPFGDRMIIFGGFDGNAAHNDVWSFVYHRSVWRQEKSTDPPPERHQHCAVVHEDNMIVLGGTAGEMEFDEVWSYSINKGTWTLLSSGSGPKFALGGASLLGSRIIVSGGMEGAIIHDAIWQFDLVTDKWTKLTGTLPQAIAGHTQSTVSTDTVIMTGGETFFSDLQLEGFMWAAQIKGTNAVVATRDVQKVWRAHHRVVIGANELIIFGGNPPPGWGVRIPTLTSNEVLSMPLSVVEPAGTVHCIPGAYRTGARCEFCPPGTYTTTYDAASCIECPVGTASDLNGASSSLFCVPCIDGTYASKTRSVKCLSCPPGHSCPLGSIDPVVTSEIQSLLPIDSSKNTIESTYTDTVDLIEIVVGVVVACIVFGILAACVVKWVTGDLKSLEYFDILFSHHHKCSKKGHRIQYPTVHGGVFTLIVIPLGLLLAITIFSHLLTNRWQHAYMLPRYLFDVGSDGGVVMQASLVIKGCPLDWGADVETTCPSYVTATPTNVNILSGETSMTCRGGFTGRTKLRKCEVTFTCPNCALVENVQGALQSSSVTFVVTHASIHSLQYLWTLGLSSTTGGLEVVGSTLDPPSGTLFRGSTATVVDVTSIPSVRQDIDRWEKATKFGYTSVVDSTTLGSALDEVGYNTDSGIAFTVRVTPTKDTYIDERHNLVPTGYIVVLALMSMGCVYAFSAVLFTHLEYLFVNPKQLRHWEAFSLKDPISFVSNAIEKARIRRMEMQAGYAEELSQIEEDKQLDEDDDDVSDEK
eukprot:PhM_4_TR15252/c0_g1_i2/m.54608